MCNDSSKAYALYPSGCCFHSVSSLTAMLSHEEFIRVISNVGAFIGFHMNKVIKLLWPLSGRSWNRNFVAFRMSLVQIPSNLWVRLELDGTVSFSPHSYYLDNIRSVDVHNLCFFHGFFSKSVTVLHHSWITEAMGKYSCWGNMKPKTQSSWKTTAVCLPAYSCLWWCSL